MTATLRSDGTLVVRAHDVLWLWIAAALLVGAAAIWLVPPTKGHPALGSAALIVVAVAALAAYQDRVAEFRPRERRVHWMRRTLRGRERGTLRFDGISAVALIESRRRSTSTYTLCLLTGGRRFVLTGSRNVARARYEEVGRTIAEVLSVGRVVPFVA